MFPTPAALLADEGLVDVFGALLVVIGVEGSVTGSELPSDV